MIYTIHSNLEKQNDICFYTDSYVTFYSERTKKEHGGLRIFCLVVS